MLSEISQSQKGKHCKVLLIWDTKSSQIHRQQKRDFQGPRVEGNGELLFK